MAYYGLPIHIIRDLYLTFRSFVIRINDILKYRQATADMDKKYPKATEADLQAALDRVCIICREEMAAVGEDGPRRLPCGHLFHTRCLRSWLERQQACPTCRKSVITPPTPSVAQQYPGNMVRAEVEQARYRPGAEIHMAPEDLEPLSDGRFVIRETMGTDRPVYVERVTLSEAGSLSASRPGSAAASSAASTIELELVRDRSMDTLEDQIEALNEVNREIELLLSKAQRIKDGIAEKDKDVKRDE